MSMRETTEKVVSTENVESKQRVWKNLFFGLVDWRAADTGRFHAEGSLHWSLYSDPTKEEAVRRAQAASAVNLGCSEWVGAFQVDE